MSDPDVVSPKHYTSNPDGRETLDRIRDCLGDVGVVAFALGNAIKYLDRQGKKGSATQDVEKARFYLRYAAHVQYPQRWDDPRPHAPPYQRGEVDIGDLFDLIEVGNL